MRSSENDNSTPAGEQLVLPLEYRPCDGSKGGAPPAEKRQAEQRQALLLKLTVMRLLYAAARMVEDGEL
jgi:hypothetical protein